MVVDAFGASKTIQKTWKKRGETGIAYDIKCNPAHDIVSRDGFFVLLMYCLMVPVGGLIVGGPPCSLFTFLSSSVHMRADGYEYGDESNYNVRLANRIALNFMFILKLMHMWNRKVYWVIEQPKSSWMMKLPEAQELMDITKAERVFTYMGAFGHVLLKASHLFGNLPTLSRMAREKPIDHEKHDDPDRMQMWEDSDGIKRVTGGKNLPQTAEYTPLFCSALYSTWLRSYNFTLP
ncbi:unnamed protein product [Prorocentrum cordatum]|uniref:Uncharacterized protein n=1 Tax=Prorocentrum cordatum TaxID=2364126 RepID=A0ABN9T7Q2_9DINO|nr:unnamed protein product [Polarella glacialis]